MMGEINAEMGIWFAFVVTIVVVWLMHRRWPGVRPDNGLSTIPDSINSSDDTRDTDLQSSMSSLPDAVMLLGSQWELKWANDSARELFGLNPDRDLEQPVWQLVTTSGFAEYLSNMSFEDSFDCAAPAQSAVQLGIRVVPYRSGLYLLQGRDITRITRLDQIRKDFVANASHELRTPLSILYGYLEVMKDEPKDKISEQWKPAVDQMYEQTGRIKQIIDDMMLLSRLEDPEDEVVHEFTEMEPMLQTACLDARALAKPKGQAIRNDIDENYSLLCNPKEIQSLITNLISNAVRYTPDNGEITIRWKVDLVGGYLTVSDTGIGIEPDEIPRLTERFYRTDPARSRAAGGTGLGLAIVNHIVNRHQGNLIIQSKPGVGSEFTVHFPVEAVRSDHEQVNLLLN